MGRTLALLLFPSLLAALSYEVHIEGIQDPATLRSLYDASQLISLQSRPPASINSLRYRMASDVPELLRVLRAFAYYDASIRTDLEVNQEPYQVYLFIEPGPQYQLSSYEVYNGDCKQIAQIVHCEPFSPKLLGLELGQSANSIDLVNAELKVLTELSRCGYPLAFVDKRRVEVDMKDKTVQAASCVQEGPLTKFGPSSFFGLHGIRPRFVESKFAWDEGDIYNSDLIAEAQERLLKSELFSSVYVTHGEELDERGELPIKFRFSEAKHQRISLGAFYGTVDGPGFTFAWSHRNIGGMGDILSGKGEVSKALFLGNLSYKRSDFPSFDQTLRAFGEISRENIHAYLSFIYRGASYIDWKIDPRFSLSGGMKAEHINVSHAAATGTYLLLGVPFFLRYDYADSVMDPTQGCSVIYSGTAYQSLFASNQHFVKQRLTGNFYIPFDRDKRFVLALRTQFGSIAGSSEEGVPLTKRFLGGSVDDLRGYRYKTVSPLDSHRKPYGGRSAIFATAEGRIRITKTIGFVPFADFGTVSSSQLPNFNTKWYKSVGAGFRYFTFFGPLRFDVGFPLNRRKGVDPKFQIYATVGQTF